MSYRVELQFHDHAHGHEAEILWRSQLPDAFATAGAAATAGRGMLGRMSKPADVVSFRIVDDAGNVHDEDGAVIGRKEAA